MTNYIDEMMKTAGVQEHHHCFNEYTNDFMPCEQPCEECSFYDMKLPDFTAAKQFEIIKLLSEGTCTFSAFRSYYGDYYIIYGFHKGVDREFTPALAKLVTTLIKYKEVDKQKVKEILER